MSRWFDTLKHNLVIDLYLKITIKCNSTWLPQMSKVCGFFSFFLQRIQELMKFIDINNKREALEWKLRENVKPRETSNFESNFHPFFVILPAFKYINRNHILEIGLSPVTHISKHQMRMYNTHHFPFRFHFILW